MASFWRVKPGVATTSSLTHDLEAIQQGKDPKAIIRDPSVNRAVALPVAEREAFIEGFTRAEMVRNPLARRGLQGYIFQTGQPSEVRAAFLAAMGFTEEEATADPRSFDPLAPPAARGPV